MYMILYDGIVDWAIILCHVIAYCILLHPSMLYHILLYYLVLYYKI